MLEGFNGIADSLRDHDPADPAEAEHLARTLELLETNSLPFSRATFDPGHVTASAWVVSPIHRRVLLLWHKKIKRWVQPGGHLEPGDDGPEAGALREATEETGLTNLVDPVLFDVDVHPIPAHGSEPAHSHFDLRFRLFVNGLPNLSDAETEARWFTAEEVEATGLDSGLERMLAKSRLLGWL